MLSVIHHYHHHLFCTRQFPPRQARVGRLPIWSPLPYPFTPSIQCKPSTFISSSTHSFQVFLFLPLHLTPATSIPSFYRPTPNHPHSYAPDVQTTSICHVSPHPPHSVYTPEWLYKSTLRCLAFSDTPHIHLTIIHSILSRLCRFIFFIAQVSVPYVNTLLTRAHLPFEYY